MECTMQYVLKERIGLPDLFCGREEEMKRLIDWGKNRDGKK